MLNDFNEKIITHRQFTPFLRKIIDEATNRILPRTAKEQQRAAMEILKQNSLPESDNFFVKAKHLV